VKKVTCIVFYLLDKLIFRQDFQVCSCSHCSASGAHYVVVAKRTDDVTNVFTNSKETPKIREMCCFTSAFCTVWAGTH